LFYSDQWFFDPFRERVADDYFLAVGRASFAWNELHKNLSQLYAMLTIEIAGALEIPCPDGSHDLTDARKKVFAKWHRQLSYSKQRKLISSRTMEIPDNRWPQQCASKADVFNLIDTVDALGRLRQHVTDLPVSLYISSQPTGAATEGVRVVFFVCSDRSLTTQRAVIDAFNECFATAVTLAKDCKWLEYRIRFPQRVPSWIR
jgi:hypothetical protein